MPMMRNGKSYGEQLSQAFISNHQYIQEDLIICRIITAKIHACHVRFIIILYSNGYNFNNKTLFYI